MSRKSILLVDKDDIALTYLGDAYEGIANISEPIPFGYSGPFHEDAMLAIGFCQFFPDQRLPLIRAREAGLGTLLLADGILEWRNTWQHPDLMAGCMYQPVVTDKMACLGEAQAALVESWGNHGKCEVTGSPRFDRYFGRQYRKRRDSGEFRILVMSAKNPGFTAEQRDITRAAFCDLAEWFGSNPEVEGRHIEPVWRLTDGIGDGLALPGSCSTLDIDLRDELSQADAVITTQSTTILESMLAGLPTAVLDYHNCPNYVDSAWRISAPCHIGSTIRQLICPSPERIQYQDHVLRQNLYCDDRSAPRLLTLIHSMLEIVEAARRSGRKAEFPSRILRDKPAVCERGFGDRKVRRGMAPEGRAYAETH